MAIESVHRAYRQPTSEPMVATTVPRKTAPGGILRFAAVCPLCWRVTSIACLVVGMGIKRAAVHELEWLFECLSLGLGTQIGQDGLVGLAPVVTSCGLQSEGEPTR